jgi:hypothetical protein
VVIVLLRFIISNFALLQSVDYQSYLLKQTVRFFANRYDIHLSVGDMEVKLPNRIILENVYVGDVNRDTLLHTKTIEAHVSAIKLRKKRLYMSRVLLDKPIIYVEQDSSGTFNFQYILDRFASGEKKEPSAETLDLFVEEFAFRDADISYKDAPWETTPGFFNSSDILVNGFDVYVHDFQMHGDTIELDLSKLAFQEKSGFGILKLNSRVFISDSLYQLKDFFVKTNHSLLHAPTLEIAMLNDSIADVWNDININMHIDSSLLSLQDAAYFSSDLKGLNQQVNLSARLLGKLSNIKLRDFNFAYGNDTRLIGDVSINGLPEPRNSFIFAEVKRLSSSVRDAESFYLPPFDQQKPVQVPEILHEVGIVNFEGTLTGMFNDLVADGLFQTNAGNITTDVAVKSYGGEGDVKFEGLVNVMNLELGSLLDKKELLGTLDMNANLRGTLDTLGRYDISMGSTIEKAEVYNYPYSNIEIAGHLTNTSFNGELMISDPNLSFEFIGGYEMKDGVPDMDFRADFSANPYELNLDTIQSSVGFLMLANFVGDGINTASGNLQFANMFLKRQNDSVAIDKLDINTGKILDEQFIDIKSDYFDFESRGHYDIPKLMAELSGLIYNYFPALSKEEKDWLAAKPGRLSFNASFHDLDELTSFFMPSLSVTEDVSLSGVLDASANKYSLNCNAPQIQYDTIKIQNLNMELLAGPESLGLDLQFDKIQNKSNEFLENFTINTLSTADTTSIALNWDNEDSLRYAGSLNATVGLVPSVGDNIAIAAHILPSDFILKNENWVLDESRIMVDTTEISVDRLEFYNNDQRIRVMGNLSQNENKDMRYYIENFDISVFNPFLKAVGYQLQGILNSNGRVADVYDQMAFRAFLELEDLYVNNEEFGRIQINSNWDYLTNAIKVDGNSRYIDFRGNLNPAEDAINLSLNINNFGLGVLEPYLVDAGLLNVRGKIDGSVDVKGKMSEPEIRGALDFDRAGLTYDMLMARFNLSDSIFVYTDSLVFKNFIIEDEYGNPGVIRGKLTHNKFKNIRYDFDIGLENYHILNTSIVDNSNYYGSAYATARANINGSTEDITIDISEAKTEKNTVFVLPMTNSYEADDAPWITFIQDSVTRENMNELVPESKFDVTFMMNIDVTPDAEARLVFDPKVGDMIRANCDGNLSIEVTPDSDFAMKGELEVKGGNYLFTLQNVINKRFVLKDGGRISWDGDPTDGELDLEAAYKLKAPLYDIMVGVDTSDIYKKRTEVQCLMEMTGKISNPDIRFDIKVPNADEQAKTRLASLSPDEINKQVLTLLVLNRFYTPDDMQMAGADARGANIAGVTSFEMLSNQVSNWLSQISDDFDVGINYSPGDEITSQELEVALSTQLLNDRVLINGNVGVGEHESTNSDIVGDVEVQVKVNKSGNLRVKGFTRANTQSQMQYDYGPYTQGVGLFYTESFSTFRNLVRRYFTSIFPADSDEKQQQPETKTDSVPPADAD